MWCFSRAALTFSCYNFKLQVLDFSGVFFSGSEAKKKKALAKKAHGESSRTHATEEIEESSTTVSGTSDIKTSQVKGNKGGKGIRRVAGSETWSLCGIICVAGSICV